MSQLLLITPMKKLRVLSSMTLTLLQKLKLPTTKLPRSIETSHNAMSNAQLLMPKKMFQFADQPNQKTTKTLIRNTPQRARALLSSKKMRATEEETA
jgi:hypothetical protein